jgi:transcriptional regulator with XRE-family HTH domain
MLKENINYLISSNRLKLSEFGKILGVSDAVIGTYKSGRSNPSIDSIVIISEKFNVSCDHLLKTDLSTAKNLPNHVGKFGVIEELVIKIPVIEKEGNPLKITSKNLTYKGILVPDQVIVEYIAENDTRLLQTNKTLILWLKTKVQEGIIRVLRNS